MHYIDFEINHKQKMYGKTTDITVCLKFIQTLTHKRMANMHVQIQHKTHIKVARQARKKLFGDALLAKGLPFPI